MTAQQSAESTSQADAAVVTTDASSASEVEQQASETQDQPSDPPKDAPPDASSDDSEKATGEAEKADEPEGAPETYEFKAPEGREFDADVLNAYSDVARELNLTQESAQKVLDKVGPVLEASLAKQTQALREQWAEATKADKDIGGSKLTDTLATAKKALESFGSPELLQLLNDTGLGDHPAMVRAWLKAGKAISEDSYVPGSTSDAQHEDSHAKRLFPNLA